MDLKEKLKELPCLPGVYLMKDSLGGIIYVGKSKNLKQRVNSYFHNSKSHTPKVKKLFKNLIDFEYILTDTEFEAFMMECGLIKEFKPPYNSLMKNTKAYAYIKIQSCNEPRNIELAHYKDENDCNLYFGPYTNKNVAERAIKGIQEFYKIRCSNTSSRNKPCFNYSLGLCIGMCQGGIALKLYSEITDKIIALLRGTDIAVLKEMEQHMFSASNMFDFETAAKYRDYINSLKSLINKRKIIEFTEMNKNIVMIEKLENMMFKLFLIKGNKILFSNVYSINNVDATHIIEAIKINILKYFKYSALSLPVKVSKEDLDEAQIIYNYLKASKCKYIVIREKWLISKNSPNIDKALNKLLSLLNH